MADRERYALPPRKNALERQADEVAADVALEGRRPSSDELTDAVHHAASEPSTSASDQGLRDAVGARMGADLSNVKMVAPSYDPRVWAKLAFAEHDQIHFAPGSYRPDLPLGRALIAHELVHSAQIATGAAARHEHAHATAGSSASADATGLELRFCDDGPPDTTAPPTTSTASPSTASSGSASPTTVATPPSTAAGDAISKKVVPLYEQYEAFDAVKRSLDEARKGKALEFTKKKVRPFVTGLAMVRKLSSTDVAKWETAFDDLLAASVTDKGPKDKTKWDTDRGALLGAITPALVTQAQTAGMTAGQENQNVNWLQNVPGAVFQLILDCATTTVPAALLYAAAVNEGLVDVYIRGQLSSPGTKLTDAQLSSVRVDLAVSGFQALGLDRYFEEKEEKKLPLSGYLPSGFDATKVTAESNVNEQGTTVQSAHVADLKTGLQVLVAILSRRIDLFVGLAKELKYAPPSNEEKLFHGYVFYNSGYGEGRRTLVAHAPGTGADERALVEWISKNEYPNAQKVLRTYRFVKNLGLLTGY